MAKFKLYGAIFALCFVFLGVLGAFMEIYIKHRVQTKVELRLANAALEKQNEALKENALLKEQIAAHNVATQQRYDALNGKYESIVSDYNKARKKNSGCELELATLKALLKAFYDYNSTKQGL